MWHTKTCLLTPSRSVKTVQSLTTVFSFKSLYFFSGSQYIFEKSALISFQATSYIYIYNIYSSVECFGFPNLCGPHCLINLLVLVVPSTADPLFNRTWWRRFAPSRTRGISDPLRRTATTNIQVGRWMQIQQTINDIISPWGHHRLVSSPIWY